MRERLARLFGCLGHTFVSPGTGDMERIRPRPVWSQSHLNCRSPGGGGDAVIGGFAGRPRPNRSRSLGLVIRLKATDLSVAQTVED